MPNEQFVLPVHVLSRLFRRRFLKLLGQALCQHDELRARTDHVDVLALIMRARAVEWVVYAKAPFGGPAQVLAYLARYTHRIAISEHRATTSRTRRRRSDTFEYSILRGRSFRLETGTRKCRFTARPAQARRGPSLIRCPRWRVPGHPVLLRRCKSRRVALHLRRGEGRAIQQHGPRLAPPALSLPTSVQLLVLSLKGTFGRPRELCPKTSELAAVRPWKYHFRMSRQLPRFPVVRIRSLKRYRELVDGERFRDWAFRGQADARWPLFSALSRYLQYTGVHREAWPVQEARILRIFQRKAHLFLPQIPSERDHFQWLALMQHHGAPTRLLDVTWSPYVALFFALEHGAATAAVWAIKPAPLDEPIHILRSGQRIPRADVSTWDETSYKEYFLGGQTPFVILGEPRIMNRRLIAQSGSFIIPGVLDRPVEKILSEYRASRSLLVKLELDVNAMRRGAMRMLYGMNITHATLFPDLYGLARSMAYELEYHWAYNPITLMPNPGYPPPQTLWFWDKSSLDTDVHEQQSA